MRAVSELQHPPRSTTADEERPRYVVAQLDDLHQQVRMLIDVAEALLGQFDEMERLVTKAQWSARAMPPPSKSRRP